jgi:hypothetical protein
MTDQQIAAAWERFQAARDTVDRGVQDGNYSDRITAAARAAFARELRAAFRAGQTDAAILCAGRKCAGCLAAVQDALAPEVAPA